MGLLDGFADFIKTPEGQGLLSAAFTGMATANRGTPWNNVGKAGVGGLLGYSQALTRQDQQKENLLNNRMREMQLKEMEQKQADALALRNFDYGQFYKTPVEQALANGQGPTTANAAALPGLTPQLDHKGLVAGLMASKNPALMQQGLAMLTKDDAPVTVAEGAQVYKGGKLLYDNPKKLEPKSTDDLREYEYAKTQGFAGSFYDYLTSVKKAGANNVVLPKIEVKTGESVAGQVGPLLKESREKAISGMRLVDSAGRILDAAEKGNLFAGPGANLLLKGAQVADVLGIGGKDTKEKIANTRSVVRGMAEQAVAARSQLGGQAQISNSEQELLNKATSGDIGEMTSGEIVQIAELNDRLGRQLYGMHADQLGNLGSDPNLTGLKKFYQVPQIGAPRKPRAQAGGVKFLGFE